MKSFLLSTILALLSQGCGSKATDHSAHQMDEPNAGNQPIYNEIMDIHDQVMPKMETLYNISRKLKDSLQVASTTVEKDELQEQIHYLDSVNKMMMDWMHEFKPLPDTTDEQIIQEYYETHLEKIKLIREAILTALDKDSN